MMNKKWAALCVVATLLLSLAGCSAVSALTGTPKLASKADAQQLLASIDNELAAVLHVLDQLDDVEDQDLIP
jgi:hypothetical protein